MRIVGNSSSRPYILVRLWRQLSRHRQLQFAGLLVLILASALAEIVTVGSVLPFLGVLTSPDKFLDHPVGIRLADLLGVSAGSQLLLPLAVVFAIAAILSGAIRLLLIWRTNRVAFNSGADLSVEVYRRTLYQPYLTHTQRNSSDVVAAINNKVNDVIFGALLPILQLVSSVFIVVAITGVLLVMDPLVACGTALFLGLSYLLIMLAAKRQLRRRSELIAGEQNHVLRALNEGLGGIRDVLLDGTQETFGLIYEKSIRPLRRAQGDITFIGHGPRYAIEAIGIAFIAALAYVLSQRPSGINAVLPILGALAIGAQRLLPALQQAYSSWVSVMGSRESLKDVLDLLEQPVPTQATSASTPLVSFAESIQFRDVRFRYHPSGPWVVDGLNLVIPKGGRIGFVGRTGSGKSTCTDLLMALLAPTEGQLLVDGQIVDDAARRSWQQLVAHVPQSIFLADTTLAENIAFGVPSAQIEAARVRAAADRAQLTGFIEELPEGYQTRVGERGVRLSGGQRQRIGIARALYKQASLLVFDEATSALDNTTERAVMEAIGGLGRDLTVVMVAHRLTTVQNCDMIVELEDGRIVAQGSFEELLANSASFKRMAQTGS